MITAILLSGDTEARMGVLSPQQYLPLAGKPVALHSFEVLVQSPLISEIIVICGEKYQALFPNVKFALPGARRQDSLHNALSELSADCETILVHDAIRPLLTAEDLEKVIHAALEYGAASLATPLKTMLKQADENQIVSQTLNHFSLYEVQTPQVLKKEILLKGFEKVIQEDITLLDEVSLAELIQCPVKLVMGSLENIKITTPEDLAFAENICRERIPAFQI